MKIKTALSLDLKYRPRNLKQFIGQDHIVSQFEGSLRLKKISQRYLIHGPSGSGKTTLARIIAMYVNCLQPKGIHPCGKCKSCLIFESGKDHPDVLEINFAEQRGIDDMRRLIDQSFYAPQTNFRVFILDELHQATPQAKQAFLKPLEEPAPNTIWILATTNPEKLPGTIRGRCTNYEIKAPTVQATTKLLIKVAKKEKLKIEKKLLKKIAKLVRGQPRQALVGLESVINYMHSKGSIKNIEDVVMQAVKDIVGELPFRYVRKYLANVYSTAATGALLVLREEEVERNMEYFVRLLIEYHTQACYYTLSSKLKMFAYREFYSELDKLEIDFKIKRMALILDELVKLSTDIAGYLVDAKILAITTTLRSVNIMKGK